MKLALNKNKLAEYCRTQGIRRLALFGSVLRDDFSPDSDVDVLVEFEAGRVPGLFRFIRMTEELSTLFGGRKVDLVTYKAIRGESRRAEILRTAEVFYERAA